MPYKDPKKKADNRRKWASENPDKVMASMRKFVENNRDALNERGRESYWANHAAELERGRKYRAANREKTNAASAAYGKKNRGKVNAHTMKYYTGKLNRTPPWANMKKIERIYMFAAWASKFTDEPIEVDHIIPLQGKNISGLHVETNLQILSRSENSQKNNRWAA